VRLYDLSTDIGEEDDVAAAHQDVVARATAAMKEAYRPSEEWKFPAAGAGAAKSLKAKKAK
jgi:hypothetical protein